MTNFRIKTIYAFSLLGLLFLITLISVINAINEKKVLCATISQPLVVTNFQKTNQEPITLMFVGDIMLDRGVEFMIKKYGNGDYKWTFSKIIDDLKQVDILFGNLESPISDKGIKVGSIYSFRADPKTIEGLTYAGFDVLSVANNHIFDYSREAMEDSFKKLKEAGISYIGGGFDEKEAHSPVIKVIRGTKIAFLAYTNLGIENWVAKERKSGISWLSEVNLKKDISDAKNQADLVIVSMHFGEEYQAQPDFKQKYFARLAIDSGADLIIGHHPHVVQPIEKYKEGYIAYSLGNFIFDQGFSEETMKGLLLEILVENGKIIEVAPRDIKINKFFQPELVD